MAISCAAGAGIRIAVAGICPVEIDSQTPGGGLLYANIGGGNERNVEASGAVTSFAFEDLGGDDCRRLAAGTEISLGLHIELYGFEPNSTDAAERTGTWVE